MEQLNSSNSGRNLLIPSNCFGSSSSVGIPSLPSSPLPRPLSSPPRLSLPEVHSDIAILDSENGPLDEVLRQFKGCTASPYQPSTSETIHFFEPLSPLRVINSSGTLNDLAAEKNNSQLKVLEYNFLDSDPPNASEVSALSFKYPNEINRSILAAEHSLKASTSATKSRKRPSTESREAEKLPRPPNSWILYRSDKIVEMKSLNLGLAQSVLSKEIAAKWHNETSEVKKEYEKKAEIIKAEHAAKYPDYKYNPKRKKQPESRKANSKTMYPKSSSPKGPKNPADPFKFGFESPRDSLQKNQEESTQAGEHFVKNKGFEFGFKNPYSFEADLYNKYPLLGKWAQDFQTVHTQGDIRMPQDRENFDSPNHSEAPERFTGGYSAPVLNMSSEGSWNLTSSSNPPSSAIEPSSHFQSFHSLNEVDTSTLDPLLQLSTDFSGDTSSISNYNSASSSLPSSLTNQSFYYSFYNPNTSEDREKQDQQQLLHSYHPYSNSQLASRVEWNQTESSKQQISKMRESSQLNSPLSFENTISSDPQHHLNHQNPYNSGSFQNGQSYKGMVMFPNGNRSMKNEIETINSIDPNFLTSASSSSSASASASNLFQ